MVVVFFYLKEAIEKKWPGMKWDIIVGNPPYGADKKGSSRFLHYMIFKTALTFCKDKLTFIMPSKPIVKQLEEKWFNVFKDAVCTHITVVDKSAFPNTTMDKTAIYYCDRKASPNDYDKQLDVDKKIYNAIDAEGHRLFLDGMKDVKPLKVTIPVDSKTEDEYKKIVKNTKEDKWYLNINRAGIKPEQKGESQWISPVLAKEDIKTRDEELEFCKIHDKTKNILECPTKEYGENLKSLMLDGLVLRYSLWLTQTNQAMKKPVFRYVPDIDYTNIDTDEKLLSECGFSDDEIMKILNYLKDFDFKTSRNDTIRDYTGDIIKSPVEQKKVESTLYFSATDEENSEADDDTVEPESSPSCML